MTSTITLVPAGKLRCVITDKLRPDKPEEHVRQRFARSLLDVYGYKKEDVEVEFKVKMGRGSKRADLVVFPPDVEHTQNNAHIIIECKREEIRPTDKNNGLIQLESYLSACMNSRFGVWVGSELQVIERVDTPSGKRKFEQVTDIPRFGADAPEPLTFQELVPADEELILIFRRCHNYIYGNQGLQKEPAFHELLKLIFCKVRDEDSTTGYMRFFISNEDRRSEIGQRNLQKVLKRLFEEVKAEYPYIFDESDEIKLEPRVLAYIVGELQRYSLLDTTADIKGVAYEQLVGSNLRGDRGEFFTPRVVCEMAVQMVLATYPEDKRLSLRCADPTCGTGGFLREIIVSWHDIILEQQKNLGRSEESAKAVTKEKLKKAADRYLAGIDFNPALVRAAQMNLVMHGDGSTNVYHTNSLLPPGEWPRKKPNNVQGNVQMGSFDVIVTNPPFGSKIPIDDTHILSQFEIATYEADNPRTSMPPEQLFIERCLQLLKPGGRLAIVLPDSILSNPGLAWLRRWILEKARIVASIDLPAVTFEPHTGTQTSVLLLQKKTDMDRRIEESTGQMIDYEVFMSTPEAVGKDRRGNTLYVRTPEGQEFEYEVTRKGRTFQEKIVFNQLIEVVKQFRYWVDQDGRMGWLNE